MKRVCALILMILLLCGCAGKLPQETPPTALPTQPPAAENQGLYAPESELEKATGGAVRVYPMRLPDCYGLHPMGEDLLVISCADNFTYLTKLSGRELSIAATAELPQNFSLEAPGLQVFSDRVSYFDTVKNQTVVLNALLQEEKRIDAPEGLTGTPLLSQDGGTLFYCTQTAIRSLELASGISKVLKESSSSGKTLHSLLLGDSVLQCGYWDASQGERYLFLSTQTGQTLYDSSCDITLWASQQRYYASFPSGAAQALVFGTPEEAPQALFPRALDAACTFLPQSDGAVTTQYSPDFTQITLDYYGLAEGSLRSCLTLTTDFYPWYLTSTGDGIVYFILYDDYYRCDVLCRWDTNALPVSDSESYTAAYFSASQPDYEGLLRCESYAREIGERYGIQVLIWKDATQVKPWDYDLEPEHRVELIEAELKLLEQRLARYPAGFLQTLAQCSSSLSICLVRSLTGSPESQSLATANGIQFWSGEDSYIALAIGEESETALYHELCHIIDTQVFNESNAYDNWDSLNPGEFEYDYDYILNQSRDDYQYLQETSRSFIDIYSMSYPKEDRARIMEYAMTPGHENLFSAPILQEKLTKLCTGIREAFDLTQYPEPLPWEQYLWRPLAPEAAE